MKTKYLGLCILLFLAVFALTRGRDTSPPVGFFEYLMPTSSAQTPGQNLTDSQKALRQKAIAEVGPSVFLVYSATKINGISCGAWEGTGFSVTEDGYIVTATHVIDATENPSAGCLAKVSQQLVAGAALQKSFDIRATDENGKERGATLIASESFSRTDLSLIRASLANGEKLKPLLFNVETEIAGKPVVVIGYPETVKGRAIAFGNVAYRHVFSGRYLSIKAPVFPGNSGGPVVLLVDWKVVGVVDLADGSSIPSASVVDFLRKHLSGHAF